MELLLEITWDCCLGELKEQLIENLFFLSGIFLTSRHKEMLLCKSSTLLTLLSIKVEKSLERFLTFSCPYVRKRSAYQHILADAHSMALWCFLEGFQLKIYSLLSSYSLMHAHICFYKTNKDLSLCIWAICK